MGLTNTAVGVISLLSPLVGAGLAAVNAGGLFALSAVFYAAAFASLHWWVREPRFVKAVS